MRAWSDSVEPIREPLMLYVEGCSSASQAPKFARGIGLKGKLYSAFVLNCYRVALLRHLVLIVKFVVPRKSGRLTDVAGSLMEYVIRVWSPALTPATLRMSQSNSEHTIPVPRPSNIAI
jgi:hypothetical protein